MHAPLIFLRWQCSAPVVVIKHAATCAACIIYCTPAALQSTQPLLLLPEIYEHVHRAVHADWARDIPQEAYCDDDGVETTLITAASTARLYCMRRKFGDGRAQAMFKKATG